jgi:2,4-dienoyl-CoA reductase-like NADH-dependent reductase (Old Yellow Enzyme family)
MAHLFDELKIKSVTLRNRIGVSPMCQYSSKEGFANDWHLVHLGSFARGGVGLVIMEASAVEPIGRITPQDHGIWSDEHVSFLRRITEFIHEQGAVAGIQLAHAGRKASRTRPWEGDSHLPKEKGGWEVVGPSALSFGEGYQTPHELSETEIKKIVNHFSDSAKRALSAGFKWLELHGAHGYLIHSFLSPLSNQRKDSYGGSFSNRTRFLKEIVDAVKKVWPSTLPLTVRFSCSDYTPGGWTIEDSVALAKELKILEVDLIDCSSGGNVMGAKIAVGANYQVPFAETIRKEALIATAAVGMITEPMQADAIIRSGQADVVLLAREFLRDPQWTFRAAKTLHQMPKAQIPAQYLRSVN